MPCPLCRADGHQLCCQTIRARLALVLQWTQQATTPPTPDTLAAMALSYVAEMLRDSLAYDSRNARGSGWAAIQATAGILATAAATAPPAQTTAPIGT